MNCIRERRLCIFMLQQYFFMSVNMPWRNRNLPQHNNQRPSSRLIIIYTQKTKLLLKSHKYFWFNVIYSHKWIVDLLIGTVRPCLNLFLLVTVCFIKQRHKNYMNNEKNHQILYFYLKCGWLSLFKSLLIADLFLLLYIHCLSLLHKHCYMLVKL
jgi:hypothetical protein